MVVNSRHLGGGQTMMTQVALVEIMKANESKMVGMKTEIEVDSYVNAVKAPTEAHFKDSPWRQWRPTTIVARLAPDYPGRSPNSIWQPNPATTWMQLPSTVVKWGPAPGILRLPKPTGVSVNPVASITIRAPGPVHYDNTRLPAPAQAVQNHPGAIRREIGVKIIHLGGRSGDFSGRRRQWRFDRGGRP